MNDYARNHEREDDQEQMFVIENQMKLLQVFLCEKMIVANHIGNLYLFHRSPNLLSPPVVFLSVGPHL
jgi:hypothetical protein